MAKYNEITNSFTAGELSPRVHNRTDLDEYKQGVEEMLNFIPQKTGGAYRRMGSEFLYQMNDGLSVPAWDNEDIALIPYRSVEGDYTIAIKIPNDYGSATMSWRAIDVDTTANTLTSLVAHGLVSGQRVYFREAVVGTAPGGLEYEKEYYVYVVSTTEIKLCNYFDDSLTGTLGIVLTSTGSGTSWTVTNNNWRVGDGMTSELAGLNLRVFSRDHNSALETAVPATNGYEQEVTFGSYRTFQELMPELKATDTLDPKGFKYVQLGVDIFITHSSGKFAPMGIRAIGTNASGATKFLPYSPMMAHPDLLNEDYSTDLFSTSGDAIKALVGFMPMQSQNTDIAVKYNIKTGESIGPNSGGGLGLIPSASLVGTIIEARDAANALIAGHFTSADVGSVIQISYPPVGTAATPTMGLMVITEIETSTTLGDAVYGLIIVGFSTNLVGPTAGSSRWAYSSFSPRSGYPKNVAFYQNRLHFGGTSEEPVTIWASDLSNVFAMRYQVLDQDITADESGLEYFGAYVASYAFRATIASRRITGITFMIDDDLELRLGTPEGDFAIGFGKEGDTGYSRDNKDIRPQSSFGATSTQAFLANTRVVYPSLDATEIRAIDTKSRDYKYLNTNVSVLADHMRYQPTATLTSADRVNSSELSFIHWQDGENILWCINSRAQLVGLTLDGTMGITAWHKHTLGGSPIIVAVTTAFNNTSRHHDVLVLTKRTIDGTVVQYIESIGETFNNTTLTGDDTDAKETEDKARYLDSFIKVNQASSTTVSGLGHLEGEIVTALYNGIYEEDLTVASGAITIAVASTEIIIGIPYISRLKTLNLDRGQQYGSSRGNTARTDRVTVSLYNSSYGIIQDGEDGQPNSMELVTTELFNGDKQHDLSQSPTREPKIIISTDKPLPLNILGITTRGVSYDG